MFITRSDVLFIFKQSKGIDDNNKSALDFLVDLKNFVNGEKNGDMRYKTPNALQTAIADFNMESSLSHGEKVTYDALQVLSSDLKWRLYEALHDFIDKFLYKKNEVKK